MPQDPAPWPAHETARLLLRAPQAADLAALHEIQSDPVSNRFHPGGLLETQDQAAELLQAWQAHWQVQGFGYWAIALLERPGELLGFGGLMNKPVAGRQALSLYFRFRPQAWGQGYAAEMAQAALRLAFGPLQAPAVLAVVQAANTPSRKTLERVGLRLKGSLADVPGQPADLLYEITAGHHATLPQLPPQATPFGA
ncbi:GNAT family N-acetyltransferase [Pelomonas sp. SE-A7]|uniref:GNAT family N-acetyltransferase n=1 Tax=Pelomonas sp. SE-A7 TaxID=3054953 RepID=UPI00259CAE6F|nr:GNAT family N-acetyltransferase [Pelomonas sp. SE-A7]MDM4766245.1 GNAT family N-acetyltransferase [Pelomonas sp. SE-A7]